MTQRNKKNETKIERKTTGMWKKERNHGKNKYGIN
jgi:hypothetical protein